MPFIGILADLLAEAAAPNVVHDIGQAVSMLSGFGFAVWYAWYMTTSRIPALEKYHSEQLAEIQKRFEAHVAVLINNFRADLAAVRAEHRLDADHLDAAIDKWIESTEERVCRYPRTQS